MIHILPKFKIYLASFNSSKVFSFLFWHWWEARLNQVLVVIRSVGITSGNCLSSQPNNWSERQGVCGKAYWKWKVEVTPSRQVCSAVPWLLDNHHVFWGLGEWWLSYLGFQVFPGIGFCITKLQWQSPQYLLRFLMLQSSPYRKGTSDMACVHNLVWILALGSRTSHRGTSNRQAWHRL
jgi:hypothetical protein